MEQQKLRGYVQLKARKKYQKKKYYAKILTFFLPLYRREMS